MSSTDLFRGNLFLPKLGEAKAAKANEGLAMMAPGAASDKAEEHLCHSQIYVEDQYRKDSDTGCSGSGTSRICNANIDDLLACANGRVTGFTESLVELNICKRETGTGPLVCPEGLPQQSVGFNQMTYYAMREKNGMAYDDSVGGGKHMGPVYDNFLHAASAFPSINTKSIYRGTVNNDVKRAFLKEEWARQFLEFDFSSKTKSKRYAFFPTFHATLEEPAAGEEAGLVLARELGTIDSFRNHKTLKTQETASLTELKLSFETGACRQDDRQGASTGGGAGAGTGGGGGTDPDDELEPSEEKQEATENCNSIISDAERISMNRIKTMHFAGTYSWKA